MKTETVCHWLCQCIGASCGYSSMKVLTGTRFGSSGMHNSVDPDLPVLRNPDHEWLHTTGVRFNSE